MNVIYKVISGEELRNDHSFKIGTPNNGVLHYFRWPCGLYTSISDFEYVIAYVPNVTFKEEGYDINDNYFFDFVTKNAVVGILELQKDTNSDQIWMKYVSVDPDFKQKGICTNLFKTLSLHLPSLFDKWGKKILHRSGASKEGINATHRISQILTDAGIPWSVSQY